MTKCFFVIYRLVEGVEQMEGTLHTFLTKQVGTEKISEVSNRTFIII